MIRRSSILWVPPLFFFPRPICVCAQEEKAFNPKQGAFAPPPPGSGNVKVERPLTDPFFCPCAPAEIAPPGQKRSIALDPCDFSACCEWAGESPTTVKMVCCESGDSAHRKRVL